MIKVLYPKTAEEVVAREGERKTRTTLLMALPEDHIAKFHKIADAKEMWEAIKSRFGGNDESKKMQKYLLKQQFEDIHGAGVLHEDVNQKFLRSLPSSWSQVTLIMRTKPGLDTLNFNDLYNNLRVFERDVKGTTASSSSNTQNINDDDLEEMDLKWQVAMISMRIMYFYKRNGRKLQFDTRDTVSFDKTKVECFNCHKIGYFARDCRAKGNQDNRRRDGGYNGNKAKDNGRRPAYQNNLKDLVTIDGEAVDWSGYVEEDTQNIAMMAYSSSNSGSDNKVQTCSKACADSYDRLKKLYDEQRDKLSDASVEITAYTLVLKRYAKGMHTVPSPMTRNYMPSGPDLEINYSKFTYGPKQTSANESNSKPVEDAFSDSDSSVEPSTSVPEPVINESKLHMTWNKAHLADYQEFKGGYVAFGGSNGRITGKGKIKASKLNFEDVYYVEELEHYILFSVSQMCDKKNKILFTDTNCLVLSPNFKLLDEN
nr:ribonuclease H-like domain-containing protein [Tanacetum cinerariifolium]